MTDGAERARAARAVGAVVVVQLLAMSLWFSASAVVPELSVHWDLTPGDKAWLTASVQLGFVVGALASAISNLSDRIAAQNVMAAGAVVGAACTAAIPAFDASLTSALWLRFGTGVALACVYPPGMKLAASWTRAARGLGIGAVVGALTLGSALPHLFGALATDGTTTSWRTVLWCVSGFALLASVLALAFLRPGPALARSAPFDWRFATRSLTDRPLRLANLGYLGHMWELYAVWTWVPLFLLERFEALGWSSVSARWVAFGCVAAGGLGSVVAGWCADRVGRTRVAGTSLAVSGLCCLLAGTVADSGPALVVLTLVWGFAVVADSAQFSAAASELSDPRYVGTALALQTSLGFLLTLVSIRLVPLVEAEAGWGAAFAVLALGPIVGLVAMVRLARSPDGARLAGGRG